MANTILTPTAVTREILRVLHEKLSFIGTVNRSYDDSYAQKGAKIGDTLKIRLPNQYTVRTGKTLNAQDTAETSVSLAVATQKGVDMNFSTAELTMSLDDFSKRVINPAVAVLASNIEYSMLSYVTPKIYNLVGTAGTTPASLLTPLNARAMLNKNLAPKDGTRCLQYGSTAMASTVNALSGLFHESTAIKEQYREGMMGRTAGFDWYENERVYVQANSAGTTASTTTSNTATTVTISTTTTAYSAGTVVTFAGCYAVHPETKVAYDYLQQFTVTSATATVLTVSPSIITSGATQNCSAVPTGSGAVTVVGAASTSYPQHLAYHPDAFAFATADLEMPQGVHFAARENFDGLSIRIVRQYDINNDNIPCRLDILHGYEVLRASQACRITG